MVEIKSRFAAFLVMGVGLLAAGCQTMRAPRDPSLEDPEKEVVAIRNAWMAGPEATDVPGSEVTHAALRARAENVAFYYPRNLSARYLCALLAYESNDPVVAVHHLDDLLTLDPGHADAAVLRARIALEQGNTAYAIRLVEDKVQLRPDSASLREVAASAYYMDGSLPKARAALAEAERLGAPKYRVLYNRGLIEEAEGKIPAAAALYRESVSLSPGWAPPRERLRGLGLPEDEPKAVGPVKSSASLVPPPAPVPAARVAAPKNAAPPAPAAKPAGR